MPLLRDHLADECWDLMDFRAGWNAYVISRSRSLTIAARTLLILCVGFKNHVMDAYSSAVEWFSNIFLVNGRSNLGQCHDSNDGPTTDSKKECVAISLSLSLSS